MINIIKETNRYFIDEIEIEKYRNILEMMTNEQLGYEFSDKIGNELREFELIMEFKGRDGVIKILIQNHIDGGA